MTAARFARIGDQRDPGKARGALVILADPAGRLLLQLRDDLPGIVSRGCWGFFGGGVKPGESLRAAACREVLEETGIALPPEALAPFAMVLSATARRARLYVFHTRLTAGPAQIRLGEGAGFAFLTPPQAQAVALAPVLKPVLDAYLRLDAREFATDSPATGV